MTRELSVEERFEQGTLLEVTPHPEYDDGTTHAYYVPDRARRDAGMERVQELESSEEFFDDEGGYDWDAVRDLFSPADIVERVEETVLNRADGAVENTSGARRRLLTSRKREDRTTVPVGVVKFADPDAGEDGPRRDPLERGYCWGVVQDRIQSDYDERARGTELRLLYQDDVQQEATLDARVPMRVVRAGEETVTAYLAAHDHSDAHIAHALDLDRETVRDAVARLSGGD